MNTAALINRIPRNPEDFGRVALLMGGRSAEREISLKSGRAVLNVLQQSGVTVEVFDPACDDLSKLSGCDRAFIMLHGRGGEDGTIQGFLETLGIPYTGSGVLASALAMNKVKTKQILNSQNIATAPFEVLKANDCDTKTILDMDMPVFVKPAMEGSSIGMTKVTRIEDLPKAVAEAQKYDAEVLVESWLSGPEYTVAIIGDQVLSPVRVEVAEGFYDYAAKYESNQTQYIVPCGLGDKELACIQQQALEAFNALGCKGWGRVDIMAHDNRFYVLEVNTVPGMTDHSLVPMAAKADGIDFRTLVLLILALTLDAVSLEAGNGASHD